MTTRKSYTVYKYLQRNEEPGVLEEMEWPKQSPGLKITELANEGMERQKQLRQSTSTK